MPQLLFVQGAGEDVHDTWDNKLVDSLQRELGASFDVRYPRMPNEADPKFAKWRPVLEKELASLADGAIVVGHSIGGTVLINVLAITPLKSSLAAIVLIAAPFIGEGGWDSEEIEPQVKLGESLPPGVPVLLYHGDADEEIPFKHSELYAAAIPIAQLRKLANRDHQLNNDLADVARDIRELV